MPCLVHLDRHWCILPRKLPFRRRLSHRRLQGTALLLLRTRASARHLGLRRQMRAFAEVHPIPSASEIFF